MLIHLNNIQTAQNVCKVSVFEILVKLSKMTHQNDKKFKIVRSKASFLGLIESDDPASIPKAADIFRVLSSPTKAQ